MNDERFEQLMRDALRVDPTAGQLARLEEFWVTESRRERRWRMGRRVMALAASLLAAAAVAGWIARERLGGVEVVQAPRPKRVIAFELDLPNQQPPQIAVTQERPSIGRPPTALEQFAFYARSRRERESANETMIAVVDDLIAEVAKGNADPQLAVEATGIAMAGIERELLRRLNRSTDNEKHVLVGLLAASGSGRAAPALLRLSRREKFRQGSLAAIEQIVGVAGLADVVRASNDARVQRQLMQRMLTGNNDQAVNAFLSLIQDPALRGAALAAADAAAQLPVETLLALLQSEDAGTRLSAGLVLGHVNGPEVTRRLVELVSIGPAAPTEAWIALLACRGALAEEFLTYASHQPQLLGQVNNARVRWARMNL